MCLHQDSKQSNDEWHNCFWKRGSRRETVFPEARWSLMEGVKLGFEKTQAVQRGGMKAAAVNVYWTVNFAICTHFHTLTPSLCPQNSSQNAVWYRENDGRKIFDWHWQLFVGGIWRSCLCFYHNILTRWRKGGVMRAMIKSVTHCLFYAFVKKVI